MQYAAPPMQSGPKLVKFRCLFHVHDRERHEDGQRDHRLHDLELTKREPTHQCGSYERRHGWARGTIIVYRRSSGALRARVGGFGVVDRRTVHRKGDTHGSSRAGVIVLREEKSR